MLEMKPNCERCGKALAPDSAAAFICSLECSFCGDCAAAELNHVCPNCGGELVRRPARPERLLDRFPPAGKDA